MANEKVERLELSNLEIICFEYMWNEEKMSRTSINTFFASNYANEKLLDKVQNNLHVTKMKKDRLMAENALFECCGHMMILEKLCTMN